jgi:LytS/YehU family sensor histidine kinase
MFTLLKVLVAQYHQRRTLGELNKQAHLRVLSEQLSPHFVFNALNNLRFMLLLDQVKAKQMALDISDLVEDLDLVLHQQKVSLDRELTLLNKYLRLVAIQLGDDFKLRLSIARGLTSRHCQSIQVLPMVLQLIAENAVKHGLSHVQQGFLLVQVRLFKGYVVYRLVNTLPSELSHISKTNQDSYAIGLKNIRQRLNILYGDNHVFRLKQHSHASALIAFPMQVLSHEPSKK